MIDVINRGIGGRKRPSELSRFESDVIAEAPALVIWQVGTNAVFRNRSRYSSTRSWPRSRPGCDRLADLPMDVVLMDLQYTTAIVTPEKKPLSDIMVTRYPSWLRTRPRSMCSVASP